MSKFTPFAQCTWPNDILNIFILHVCLAQSLVIVNNIIEYYFHDKVLKCSNFFRNGYSLEIALLLSVFLGMFGLDRFYLGYPGIGLAKLCTLGFMFLGQLLDIILIAAQVSQISSLIMYNVI